jgi:hypothetical protein
VQNAEAEVPSVSQAAFRIQVAAVAAQQAALTEEAARLQHRQAALDQQEQQLAAHLDARNQRLLELRDQIRQERTDWQEEKAAWDARLRSDLEELSRQRQQAATTQQLALDERERLLDLRKRLKQRWHRHWAGERTRLQRLEQQLEARQKDLQRQQEHLRQEKYELSQARLVSNGDRELGRRQLREERLWLEAERSQWQDRCEQDRAELARRARQLDERAAALVLAERTLAEERRSWGLRRGLLKREVEGLENRVAQLRGKLPDQPQEIRRTVLAEVPLFPSPSHRERRDRRTLALQQLACTLADQRVLVVEQLARVLQIGHDWQRDREDLVVHLEESALRLTEREQRLNDFEESLERQSVDLRQREEAASRATQYLDGLQTRWRMSTMAWETERDSLLAVVRRREERVKARSSLLAEVRRNWSVRRRRELARVQEELARCQEVRLQYALDLEETTRRRALLDRKERRLAERSLALEEYQLQVIGQSANSARAERRLRRLQQRWGRLFAAGERHLSHGHERLSAEAVRIHEKATYLERHSADLARREADLSRRTTLWEREQAQLRDVLAKVHAENECLRAHRHLYERHRAGLHDELERLALVLMREEMPALLPLRAA